MAGASERCVEFLTSCLLGYAMLVPMQPWAASSAKMAQTHALLEHPP